MCVRGKAYATSGSRSRFCCGSVDRVAGVFEALISSSFHSLSAASNGKVTLSLDKSNNDGR